MKPEEVFDWHRGTVGPSNKKAKENQCKEVQLFEEKFMSKPGVIIN